MATKNIHSVPNLHSSRGHTQRKVWIVKQKIPQSADVAPSPSSLPLRLPLSDSANPTTLPSQSPLCSAPWAMKPPPPPTLQPLLSEASSSAAYSAPMANFPVHPFEFAPVGSQFECGLDHRIQWHIMVVDDPPLNHDGYAPVTVNAPVPDHQKGFWLAEVCRTIREDFELEVLDNFTYPFGIYWLHCVGGC